METNIILTILLLILIVICDASKDVLKSRFNGSFFDKHPKLFPRKFWYAPETWKNKWVLDENGNPKLDENGNMIPKKWFGLIDIPDAFTDGWHFIKFILWTALILALSINLELFIWYINFVLLSFIYLFIWWLFYDIILLYNK